MTTFNTIHVFGYGETQIIGSGKNGKVKSNDLTKLTDFVDYIKSLKPEELEDSDYHVIHIFNNSSIRYLGKGNIISQSFPIQNTRNYTIKWDDLDLTTLNDLVDEIDSLLTVE
jgi:hypothetical protein